MHFSLRVPQAMGTLFLALLCFVVWDHSDLIGARHLSEAALKNLPVNAPVNIGNVTVDIRIDRGVTLQIGTLSEDVSIRSFSKAEFYQKTEDVRYKLGIGVKPLPVLDAFFDIASECKGIGTNLQWCKPSQSDDRASISLYSLRLRPAYADAVQNSASGVDQSNRASAEKSGATNTIGITTANNGIYYCLSEQYPRVCALKLLINDRIMGIITQTEDYRDDQERLTYNIMSEDIIRYYVHANNDRG